MDGWQFQFLPEQAFSLALAQERVGVMQFASPSEPLGMSFNAVVIGAQGLPGVGIDNYNGDPLVVYLLSKS